MTATDLMTVTLKLVVPKADVRRTFDQLSNFVDATPDRAYLLSASESGPEDVKFYQKWNYEDHHS